jgi:hypothetical protein
VGLKRIYAVKSMVVCMSLIYHKKQYKIQPIPVGKNMDVFSFTAFAIFRHTGFSIAKIEQSKLQHHFLVESKPL